MNEQSRLFDFLYYQKEHFAKKDMLNAKEEGNWIPYSTAAVIEKVNQLSCALLSLGLSGNDLSVEKQDKIAIISKNRPEWLMLDLACQQIGVLLCPIYPTTHVNEIEFIFNDAEIKYVFISGSDILEKINLVKSKVPSMKDVYSFDHLPGVACWESLLGLFTSDDFYRVETIKKTIQANTCATIIYTSGTTGFPKGVMLSHQNLVMNVLNATKSFPFPQMPTAKALSFLPLNHIFERVASYIYISTGVSIYYAESLETIADNLKEVQPVLFTTVPRLLEKVFEKIMTKGSSLKGIKRNLFFWAVSLAEQYDNLIPGSWWYRLQLNLANKIIFSKWREALGNRVQYIITGGAACQKKLLQIFHAAQIPVFEGYGPTENSPVISVNCNKPGGMKFGTVGLVIDGQQVKIASDGEICVKGPSVMMGYYKRPDLTAEVIIDGWLHTGDIGEWDEEKYLKITDRKKELFKTSGGKYVAPQPIENRMKESPFIEQIMVVGDNRKFVAALIVPSFSNLKSWMLQHNVEYSSLADALSNERVVAFFDEIVSEYNGMFNHVEQVRKFKLLHTEWSIETGEMTPKLSLKRKIILNNYERIINDLYEG
jgi:long-chain acyl-CoA synthetase